MPNKCTKCGNAENYNFALNIGLCNPCIGKRLEKLEADFANYFEMAAKSYTACGSYQQRIGKLEAENKQLRSIKCPPISEGDSCICPIEELETEMREVSNQLIELYNQCNETTKPEIYGSILGLHERLEQALKGE